MEEVKVMVADESHIKYIDTILTTIAEAAKKRGSGIAKRSTEYVATKMREAKAVIALQGEKFAGFSYIETWGNKHYVTTSGLIVHPDFRGIGLAKRIKNLTFTLARQRWPHAKIFSLTSGSAVMKMNTQLGYLPVTFADLTDDESFWRGCEGCIQVVVRILSLFHLLLQRIDALGGSLLQLIDFHTNGFLLVGSYRAEVVHERIDLALLAQILDAKLLHFLCVLCRKCAYFLQ